MPKLGIFSGDYYGRRMTDVGELLNDTSIPTSYLYGQGKGNITNRIKRRHQALHQALHQAHKDHTGHD